jgi:hypothetical protein
MLPRNERILGKICCLDGKKISLWGCVRIYTWANGSAIGNWSRKGIACISENPLLPL